jgi:hypothetical protein
MIPSTPDIWAGHLRHTLRSFDEPLLRRVAGKLCKPRNQWPVAELIDRCLEVFSNPPMLDRRLKELEPASRQVLAMVGHSGQPRWPVGSLIEILTALGHDDGLAPIQALLEGGLLVPELFPVGSTDGTGKARVKSFAAWLAQSTAPMVLAPPTVTKRCLGEPLPLECPGAVRLEGPVHEADGAEWPLRLAALWQQVAATPLRRTQSRDFFKRDLDRLRGDTLLGAAPTDALAELPDPGLFTAALALAVGVLTESEGDLRAGTFSPAWSGTLPPLLAELAAALPTLAGWNAAQGWQPDAGPGNPYPSANMLSLLALAQLPEGRWARPDVLEAWVLKHHPYWAAGGIRDHLSPAVRKSSDKKTPLDAAGVARFLLGVAYPLRLVQACKDPSGAWAVRLSPIGRWTLGYGEAPLDAPAFPQTLVVQPNLEILVYRQGLTPALIEKLTRFASWRTLGAACTLQLEPQSVYRALESGETQSSIMQTLERHGMKPTPAPVLEALKTWSNKRERISVYPAAVLLEFASPGDLNEALARGLPAVRLTERLAAVANESQIDYKHFRLTGTRDYCLPPEPCVEVEADGVTLSVDLARSDLLLETELQRFAELVTETTALGRRVYRLTPVSLSAARSQGLALAALASWFEQRTGLPLAPAARLLFSGAEVPSAELRRQLVLHVPAADLADGLMQWPATAGLIQARLGPTALAVAEADAPRLRERLEELGLRLVHGEG